MSPLFISHLMLLCSCSFENNIMDRLVLPSLPQFLLQWAAASQLPSGRTTSNPHCIIHHWSVPTMGIKHFPGLAKQGTLLCWLLWLVAVQASESGSPNESQLWESLRKDCLLCWVFQLDNFRKSDTAGTQQVGSCLRAVPNLKTRETHPSDTVYTWI